VVDDNSDAAEMLAMLLQAAGHDVAVANSGDAALEISAATPPDVCLLDIGLPDMDGRDLARRLRARPQTMRAALIAITGYGQDNDRQSALEAGFDHYLVKPVDPSRLTSLVNHLASPG